MMKALIYILLLVGLIKPIKAQERFFEFLPGWRNMKIVEKDFVYISFGLTSDGTALNHYQFSSFTKTGSLLNEWEFDLDTIQFLQSRFINDVSFVQGNYFVSGSIKGNTSNRAYGTWFKFNTDFTDTLWSTSFNILPGSGTGLRTHLNINSNKFILGGFLQNTDLQVYPSLMETDSLGNINWRSDFFCGSNCDLYPFHIVQTADGGYFFTCTELHNWGGSQVGRAEKTAIIKTDSLGNEQFRLHPGSPDLYTVNGWVLPTSDGNYITAYSDPMTTDPESTPQANPQSTIWLEKFDELGNQISIVDYFDLLPKLPNQNGMLYTIVQMLITNDSNILIGGYLDGVEDTGFIIKITQQGQPLWYRFISPPQAEGNNAGGEWTKIRGITPTSDGGYIMAGEYFSSSGNIFPEGIQTAFAAKVDEFGCLEPGCQIGDGVLELKKANLGLTIYPNPTSGLVSVSVGETVQVKKVRIYELMGQIILEHTMSDHNLQLDVSWLAKGMYLLEVETNDGFREIKRLIVE